MSLVQARALASLLIISLLALYAQGAKIVVTFPAYNVVLKEAFPNADVILITKGATDPHEYQLTPEDRELLTRLESNDVIVSSAHAPFELRIEELVKQGEIKAKYIDLTKIQTYLTWDGKEIRLGEGQGHGGVNLHDHGLYPPNVLSLVEAVSNATGMRPDPNFLDRLKELDAKYGGKFSGKAVALTPAAQYLLHWLGYNDVVVLIKEPGVPPTAKDLQKALQYAKEGAPVVATFARDRNPRLIQMFTEKAKEAGITPHIIEAEFSTSYISTLEKFVESFRQTPAGNKSVQVVTPAGNKPAGATAPSGALSVDAAWLVIAVVVLIAVFAFVLVWRKRK